MSALQLDLIQYKDTDIFSDLKPHIVRSFWEYHERNPGVFDLFVKFSTQLKTAGRKRYGAKSIFERMRWHFAVESNDEDFKLNNNYFSCYARLLSHTIPEFYGFFETRRAPRAA